MSLVKIRINNRNIGYACLIIFFIVVGSLFGITGIRTMLGWLVFYFMPFYLVLNNFNLDSDEKVFFAFFLSIGLYPLLVWYVDRIILSLRISIVISSLLLVGISFLHKYLLQRSAVHKQPQHS